MVLFIVAYSEPESDARCDISGRCSTTAHGGTLIFSHIRRLGPFFRVQNLEFQYFSLVFRKMNNFWSMKILWTFFFFWGGGGVITKLDWFQGSFLCILGSFLEVNLQNGDIFWGCLYLKYFLGVWVIFQRFFFCKQ